MADEQGSDDGDAVPQRDMCCDGLADTVQHPYAHLGGRTTAAAVAAAAAAAAPQRSNGGRDTCCDGMADTLQHPYAQLSGEASPATVVAAAAPAPAPNGGGVNGTLCSAAAWVQGQGRGTKGSTLHRHRIEVRNGPALFTVTNAGQEIWSVDDNPVGLGVRYRCWRGTIGRGSLGGQSDATDGVRHEIPRNQPVYCQPDAVGVQLSIVCSCPWQRSLMAQINVLPSRCSPHSPCGQPR